jgi:hypothetical protein
VSKWVGPGRIEVERIRLNGRQVLRVRKHGFIVTYARSIAELARHVDLADLVEVVALADHRKPPTGRA